MCGYGAFVEAYADAWLASLGLDHDSTEFTFDTPSGGVELTSGPVAGQVFLTDQAMAEELIRYAGLQKALDQTSDWARLDLDAAPADTSGVHKDGVYIQLAGRDDSGPTT